MPGPTLKTPRMSRWGMAAGVLGLLLLSGGCAPSSPDSPGHPGSTHVSVEETQP
jgi:hypothetical protein